MLLATTLPLLLPPPPPQEAMRDTTDNTENCAEVRSSERIGNAVGKKSGTD
jgi:hypothetical protein